MANGAHDHIDVCTFWHHPFGMQYALLFNLGVLLNGYSARAC